VANIIYHLKDDFQFFVVTSNHDIDGELDLNMNDLNCWLEKDGYYIMYLDQAHQNRRTFKALAASSKYDLIYFNSLFSKKFTLLPLWEMKSTSMPLLLAPRGMLGVGALALKPLKKRLFLKVFKFFRLHQSISWHATGTKEVDEIKTHFGQQVKVFSVPNLASKMEASFIEKQKITNELRVFFLSRISIKKNLLGALKYLLEVPHDYGIHFTIYGPVEDLEYWNRCKALMKTMPTHVKCSYKGAIAPQQLHVHLAEQHIMLLPTQHENYGHVIMEAWQNACPVITSDQTPWRALQDKQIGYDLPLTRPKGFTDALTAFAAMDFHEFNKWSKASFDFARVYSDNPKLVTQTKEMLATVMQDFKRAK